MSSALRTARGSPGTGSRCRSRPLRGRDGRAGSKCGRLGEGGRGKLSALAQTLTGDSRALRGARRQGGRGRDEALVPGCRPAGRSRRPTRPRSRGRRRSFDAGPAAVERFLEFFAARIANDRAPPTGGLGLQAITPLHVAAYIQTHPGFVPTVEAAPGRDPGALRLARGPTKCCP